MTNEAANILHRLAMRDRLKAVKDARELLLADYPYFRLHEDLLSVIEYLQEQIDYENYPAEGSVQNG